MKIIEKIESLKRTHHYCEDSWYSCPKAEDGCSNELEGDECNCGAESYNKKLDKIIEELKIVLPDDEQLCLDCEGVGVFSNMEDCRSCNGTGILPKMQPSKIKLSPIIELDELGLTENTEHPYYDEFWK